MEPIQPQFPWQSCRYGIALPEAELILATINQAYIDALGRNPSLRREARRWFYTRQFEQYCELLGFNALEIHENIIRQWSKK